MLTCPKCGGVLWELSDGQLVEYRCHVGHVYSTDSLAKHQAQFVGSALWAAIRALSEKAVLTRRLASRASAQNHDRTAQLFDDQARAAAEAAAVLRQIAENDKR